MAGDNESTQHRLEGLGLQALDENQACPVCSGCGCLRVFTMYQGLRTMDQLPHPWNPAIG